MPHLTLPYSYASFTSPYGYVSYASLNFIISGSGIAITTGIKGDLEIPYDCTIIEARLLGDQSGSIVVDEPENLWDQLGQATCVSENDYREYFAGSKRACGIVVDKAWRFHEGITLTELRARLPGFVPPQSFKYLRSREVRSILATTPITPSETM